MQVNKIPGPWKSSQRIIIGVSSSPDSTELIRWARRVSYTMDASWVAVHIETPVPPDENRRVALNKNLELARELGAEVIVTSDIDVVTGLIRTAKNENATLIVIGKSPKKKFIPGLFKTDIVNRLLNESGTIDVFVVSGSPMSDLKEKNIKIPVSQSGVLQYFVSAGIVFAFASLLYPLSSLIGYQTIALILLLVVTLLPLVMGPGPVLLAAFLSPVIWNYFFVPPKFTFLIGKSEDILMFVSFFFVALVTGVLTTRIRQREKVMKQREGRAVALYRLANDLSKAIDLEEVINESVKNIKNYFNVESFIRLAGSDGKLKFNAFDNISPKELSVAEWVYANSKKAGRFTDSLPFAEYVYYPLSGPRGIYGIAAVKFFDKISFLEQESLLKNFLNQTGSAVEREILNDRAGKALILEESEKLYKTLFDSLSHELKTPISAIMGSVSFLIDRKNEGDAAVCELYKEINTASIRLNVLVENLLDMARLESGKLVVNKKPCEARDLINSVLDKQDIKEKRSRITADLPENMPLINIDFILLEQALVNIFRNALAYTPEEAKIKLQCSFDESFTYITVSDNGFGVPEQDLDFLFDKFYRLDRKNSGGTGLGLSISKGIIDAHKGTINAYNMKSGGLKFVIKLPR